MYPLIIEPRALFDSLPDPDVMLVDLSRIENHEAGHIAGAIHVLPAELVSGVRPAVGKLPPLAQLNALFSRIGYEPGKHIIAYDDEGGGWAGRFLWTLDMIGHKQQSFLNGGLVAWVGEGFPTTSETVVPEPRNVKVILDPSRLATREQVLASLPDAGTVVWDARSREEHSGAKAVSARGGHIPGAINLDWLDVMDRNNHLKIRADIAAVLDGLGITRDKRVITHCQSHHRSGLTYLVGKSLGYDIRAYDGSWSEWGNDPTTPVETE